METCLTKNGTLRQLKPWVWLGMFAISFPAFIAFIFALESTARRASFICTGIIVQYTYKAWKGRNDIMTRQLAYDKFLQETQ